MRNLPANRQQPSLTSPQPAQCRFIAISYGLTITGEAYAVYALRTAPGSLPGGGLMSWLGNWAWGYS
jgi:hypothetical protein